MGGLCIPVRRKDKRFSLVEGVWGQKVLADNISSLKTDSRALCGNMVQSNVRKKSV